MPNWIVQNRSTGSVVYAYGADTAAHFDLYPLETFNHIQKVEEVEAPRPGRITRLAFRNRFTVAEKATMEIAALDNAAAPMAQRQQAAVLRAYMADVAASTFVDLQRPDTRAGVQQLEAMGLLATGRAAEILDAPPSAAEVFND